MRLGIKQFMAVAGLTALEAIRQPICLLLTATCIVFISLMPVLIMHTMGDAQKLVQDSALAFQFVCGLLLGGYAASAALGREIRRGTVSAVLSKPVGRELFFLAKFAGVVLVLLWFALGTGVTILLTGRMSAEAYTVDWWAGTPLLIMPVIAFITAGLINYSTERPFVSAAFVLLVLGVILVLLATSFVDDTGKPVAYASKVAWKYLPVTLLVTMATIVLAGVAVSLATRLETVPTLSLCSVLFLIGLMSDYLLGRHAVQNKLAALLYGLVPNWQHFWIVDALTGEKGAVPWSYVGQAGLYAVFYLAGVLCLGILAFRNIEIKA